MKKRSVIAKKVEFVGEAASMVAAAATMLPFLLYPWVDRVLLLEVMGWGFIAFLLSMVVTMVAQEV